MMINKQKIAVLGAGHGGRAMAAFLAAIGNNVNLYNRTPENIPIIQQLGGIYLTYAPDLEDDIFPESTEFLDAELKHEYSLTPKTEHLIEEDAEEWESFDERKIGESLKKEFEGFMHGDYTLY